MTVLFPLIFYISEHTETKKGIIFRNFASFETKIACKETP